MVLFAFVLIRIIMFIIIVTVTINNRMLKAGVVTVDLLVWEWCCPLSGGAEVMNHQMYSSQHHSE
jgi:hypothetical protein